MEFTLVHCEPLFGVRGCTCYTGCGTCVKIYVKSGWKMPYLVAGHIRCSYRLKESPCFIINLVHVLHTLLMLSVMLGQDLAQKPKHPLVHNFPLRLE